MKIAWKETMNFLANVICLILSKQDLGNKAAKQTIRKLSPKKIGSEKINIIFDKRISKGMLSAFASAISASAIARGTSFLKDKIDQQVFAQFDKCY